MVTLLSLQVTIIFQSYFFSHNCCLLKDIPFLLFHEIICCYAHQDLQKGLDLGLVSPEVLQNFFDLEQYPIIKELTHRFQVYLLSGSKNFVLIRILSFLP